MQRWVLKSLHLSCWFFSAFDLIWVAFVGALVARHTAYMSTNITTYEVLVRPAHVQRRFPKNRGRFWFLADFGIGECIRNWIGYWTLNTEHDAADFLGAPPQESFVAAGGIPGGVLPGPGMDKGDPHFAAAPPAQAGVGVAPSMDPHMYNPSQGMGQQGMPLMGQSTYPMHR